MSISKKDLFVLKQQAAELAMRYAQMMDAGHNAPVPTKELMDWGKSIADEIRRVGVALWQTGWEPPCQRCGKKKGRDQLILCEACVKWVGEP